MIIYSSNSDHFGPPEKAVSAHQWRISKGGRNEKLVSDGSPWWETKQEVTPDLQVSYDLQYRKKKKKEKKNKPTD